VTPDPIGSSVRRVDGISKATGRARYTAAEGVGEGGMLAVAPAVGNVVPRALGVRICDLPLTPGRARKASRMTAPEK
jgi:CO/xanthine dehydrogenase Mo-binding subunit